MAASRTYDEMLRIYNEHKNGATFESFRFKYNLPSYTVESIIKTIESIDASGKDDVLKLVHFGVDMKWIRCLKRAGINNITDASRLLESGIFKIRNLGAVGVNEITLAIPKWCDANGITIDNSPGVISDDLTAVIREISKLRLRLAALEEKRRELTNFKTNHVAPT